MPSRTIVYFAGMGTVVAALGVGFGFAIMLTKTTPVHKEPAAGYAKREQPVEPPVAPAVAVTAPAQAVESPPDDAMAGLGPPITALPIPKTDEVTRALASNPPSADPSPPPAAAEPSRPVPVSRPQQTDGSGGAEEHRRSSERKELAEQKRKGTSQKQLSIAVKEPPVDRSESEDAPATKSVPENFKGETDRPTKEGF